ncbi:hypothetical protein QYM36_006887 [Artemia franciscana]|uniref:Uncharacterized protein n=1 Tax=Artemia franciscana TaxID=6661 RepID=A0AA88HYG4_ARTSF|nr:hypothetical protein QYM36_006887 [Artemia franciscana]
MLCRTSWPPKSEVLIQNERHRPDKIYLQHEILSSYSLTPYDTSTFAHKISAYTSYVRPQLEYTTVIWSPCLKKDIDRIEQVQKRFVNGLQGFRNLPYDEAL